MCEGTSVGMTITRNIFKNGFWNHIALMDGYGWIPSYPAMAIKILLEDIIKLFLADS